MRIAMITADYLPDVGGIASHVVELSKALVGDGHDVRVWFWDPHDRETVSTDTVPTERLYPQPYRLGPSVIRQSRGLAATLRAKIAQWRPEILHVHTMAPLSLAMRWLGSSEDYRRIFTNHSSGYLNLVKTWPGRRRARFYCGAFDGLLAPSQQLLDESMILGIPSGRCAYIANAVDPEKFAPADRTVARAELGLDPSRPVILSTRRFAVKNGVRYLAEALGLIRQAIPDVLCVFCGDACDEQEWHAVQAIVEGRKLSDCVRFEGAVPNDRIRRYLAACDVVVLPSLMEATSISGLEAMSAARPLVGTRVGGIPDLIVDGRTGVLVEPRDVVGLAEAIVRVLRDCDREAMGQAARHRVLEEFTWQRVAERTLEFYRGILDKRPK